MMLVKPYLLTPISKYSAIECFLIQQLMDGGNFVWMTLFLPYTFIVWCGGISGWTAIGMLCLAHLMVLVNSQWYLLVRTLVNQSLFWWALPLAFYGSLIAAILCTLRQSVGRLLDFIGNAMPTTPSLGGLSASSPSSSSFSLPSTVACRCDSSTMKSAKKRRPS